MDIVGFEPNPELVGKHGLVLDRSDRRRVAESVSELIHGRTLTGIELSETGIELIGAGLAFGITLNFSDSTKLKVTVRFRGTSLWKRMTVLFFLSSAEEPRLGESEAFYRPSVSVRQRFLRFIGSIFHRSL